MTEQQLRIEHAFTALHRAEIAMMLGDYALAVERTNEAKVILEQIKKDEDDNRDGIL